MSINNDWDVEKHKTEHECDEHWELRRKFLLTHKKKFPEDELVCLAQVFSNVELLGCRYPKETMDLVAELSKEIAAEYREKQKTKLQRTFVKASEAASSKVKGCVAQTFTITEEPISNKTVEKLKSEVKNTTIVNSYKRPSTSVIEFSPKKKRYLPFGDIILMERPNDVPQSTLAHSVGISNKNVQWVYSSQSTKSKHLCDCTIYIDSKEVASASGYNRKCARKAASVIALDRLRKYYHTIKIKNNSDTQTNVTFTTIEKTMPQDNIPDDNIGKKLMKLMGWSGGGLGKSQQGIMEPVILKQQLSRKGLGLKSDSSDMHELKTKCRIAFKEFLMGDMQNDIVFSTDFTNEERAVIHQIARSMDLKSRSYGPTDQRKLVISRKINIRSLVEELKSLGGTTEKYELIEPTTSDEELKSLDGTTEKDKLIDLTSLDEESIDLEETIEGYGSLESTSLDKELNKRYSTQTSTITEKTALNETNEKLSTIKSEIQQIATVNNHKKPIVIEFPSEKKTDLPYGDIILVEKPKDIARDILIRSICSKNLTWKYTKFETSHECTLYINSKQIARVSESRRKRARKRASVIALNKLRKYYYTIKIHSDEPANATLTIEMIKCRNSINSQDYVPDVNSEKKLMSWYGDLGKSQQDIMKPLMLKQQFSKKNLNLKSKSSKHEFQVRCKAVFKEWLMEDTENEIVFSTDFTNPEKKVIQQVAHSMRLEYFMDRRSRKLVISPRINTWSFIKELKSLGGITEKYQLIEPTNDLDEELKNLDGTTEKYELTESISFDKKPIDLDETTEKYESLEATSLIGELSENFSTNFPYGGCSTQISTITEKPALNETNEKLLTTKSEIQQTETVNNHKKPNVMEFSSEKKTDLPYGDIVLMEKPNDTPVDILVRSVRPKKLKWKYIKSQKLCSCILYINLKQVACASDRNKKYAKNAASVIALNRLRKYYYTIKIKNNLDESTNATLTIDKINFQDISSQYIPDDNIGKKMLKLMGWKGGGLGKSQQGIVEPLMLQQQLNRKGFGLKSSSSNMYELRARCRSTFNKYLMRDLRNQIEFSTEFTNNEREVIQQVARSMRLKYQIHSSGKLVISRKTNSRILVEQLKSIGGITGKYELIEPTNDLDEDSESFDATTEKYESIEPTNDLDEDSESFDETTEKYELTESTSLDKRPIDLDKTTEKYELIESTSLDKGPIDLVETTEKYDLIESTSLDKGRIDLDETEKYESLEPISFTSVEELNKRCIAQTSTIYYLLSTITEKPVSNQPVTSRKLRSKIRKTEEVNKDPVYIKPTTSVMEYSSEKTTDLPYGDIILVEKPGDAPQSILDRSIGNKNMRWVYTQSTRLFTLYINSKQVACVSGCNKQNAVETGSVIALDTLRKYYPTLKIKEDLNEQTNVTTIKKTTSKDNVANNNSGKNLMKVMDCNGDSLAKSQQGIVKPLTFKQQISRESLCLKSSSKRKQVKAKCKVVLREFLMRDTQLGDLIFSTDFTDEERTLISHMSCSMGLKSHEYGCDKRKLMVSRKINIPSLVKELKSLGGITDKYELIEPNNFDDKLQNLVLSTDKYKLIESSSLDEELKDLDKTTEERDSIELMHLIEELKSLDELAEEYELIESNNEKMEGN